MIIPRKAHTPLVDVLHLVNGEQYSGLERVVDHLSDQAAEFGYRLHLVMLKPGLMAERMQSRAATVHSVAMRSRFDFGVIPRILHIARDTSSVLVHSHTVRGALIALPVSSFAHLPWLHQVHSPALQESENKRLNRINARIERFLLPRAAHLLPVSRSLAGYLNAQYGIASSKFTVIPNGIKGLVRKHGQPASAALTIAAVGLFRPRKGMETLLTALHELAEAGLEFKARLIGEFVNSVYEQAIRAQVPRLALTEHVEFRGFCADVPQQLADVDIFALPSLYGEGMSMALLEAMSMECAIVASDIDGVSELIEDGVSGLLTPPGDAAALARALGRLMEDPAMRQRMAQAAAIRQKAEYSAGAMARRVFTLYDRFLKPAADVRTLPGARHYLS